MIMSFMEPVTPPVVDESMPFGAKLVLGVIVLVLTGIIIASLRGGSGRPTRK